MRRLSLVLGSVACLVVACASGDGDQEPDVTVVRPGDGGEGGQSVAGGAGGKPAQGGQGGKSGQGTFPVGGFPTGGTTGGAGKGGSGGAGQAGEAGGEAGEGGEAGAGQAGQAGAATTDCQAGQTEVTGACGDKCGQQVRTCGPDGTWGAPSCQDEGVCSPGQTEDKSCGNCGTQKRTCSATCEWGSFGSCGGQGVCSPGDEQPGSCQDCSHQVCNNSCQWSGCQLRPGNDCNWSEGKNWQCCGNDQWQFCSKSCHWFACDSCGSSCSSQCN